jgi:pimeloyl-ACP methyl ester carboxylesterase
VGAHRLGAQVPATTPPASQNPSPMVESTRAHARIPQEEPPGTRRTFIGPLDKPVQVFVPLGGARETSWRLVVHFHGAALVPEVAASRLGRRYVTATVNLAPGSGIYDRTFSDPVVYDSLLARIARQASDALGKPAKFDRVILVGFSAGHGAIRAILRDARHFAAVNAVVLLDGLHTSYVPEGTVIEKGGTLDETKLAELLRFARAAMTGEKRFLITHSEIFPGTFASTTETTDYLVRTLGLRRTPVLRWGPGGMQQLSEVRSGRFEILGFAGNAGPDHIDQFHGLPEFLRRVERP